MLQITLEQNSLGSKEKHVISPSFKELMRNIQEEIVVGVVPLLLPTPTPKLH